MRARDENMDVFREWISGTASITKSTAERSSRDVEGCRRDFVVSAMDWVIFDFETSLERSLSGGLLDVWFQVAH